MSVPSPLPKVSVSSNEVKAWLKKHGNLKRTKTNITKATNALRAKKQRDALPLGRDISVTVSDGPRQIVYGECRVGGSIVFLDSRASNQYLDMVVALAGHQIQSIQKVFLDDAEVILGASPDARWSTKIREPSGNEITALNKVFVALNDGNDAQTAQADLLAQNPSKWTSAHKLSGVAHAYLILVWDKTLFADGIPEISFTLRGKQLYDPRTVTTAYSNNAALVILDYLTNSRYGLGVASSRIDWTSFEDAADICDESVALLAGGTESRYTINGYFGTDESHGRVLERMAAAMGGHIIYSNGTWKCYPAAWRTPTITLTEDEQRGSLRVQTLATRDDIFNTVRGVHVSAEKNFIETDYPTVKNSTYISLDGEEIAETIDFHLVTSGPACQRLAKLEIERIRQGIQVEGTWSLEAYNLQVCDNVYLTLPRYGWTAKPFEVTAADLVLSGNDDAPELLVNLSLRETASGVFDWNSGYETQGDLAPNTNLPSPFTTVVPSGVTLTSGTSELYLRGDGTVAPRLKITWTALADFFINSGGFVEIQYKLSSSSDWNDVPALPASSNFYYLTDVQDGQNYDVRLRTRNSFGIPSAYTETFIHFVVGKTAPPSDVTGFAAALSDYGILFAWTPIADLDIAFYELREGATWDDATRIAQIKNTNFQTQIRASGSYTFLIKAVDTTGNYSTTATSTTFTIVSPSISAGSSSFNGPDAVLDWTDAEIGSWALDGYNIYYGTTFGAATFIAFAKASLFQTRAAWTGTRNFWIEPKDIYGNLGTPFQITTTVVPPGVVPSFRNSVIDNNVLLSWGASVEGSLPIDHYKIYKGATFGGATLVGQTAATYTTFFELTSGTNTYWITAVDTAGNVSTETSLIATVRQPPDFSFRANVNFTFSLAITLNNVKVETANTLLLPVETTETWTQHYTTNGWSTPQDQITAGYPIFIQPTPPTATYEQVYDYGALISSGALVSINVDKTDISSGITLTPTLSFSTDSINWTDRAGVYSSFESNFRYVKVKLAATGGGTGLVRVNSVNLTIAVKLERDSGSVLSKASDASGTTVTFNKTFYDVVGAPQVTPYDVLRAPVFVGDNTKYLSYADNAHFEPGNGDYTWTMWTYIDKLHPSQSQPILSKRQSAGQFEWLIFWSAAGNRFAFTASHDGSTLTDTTATNAGWINSRQWYFVAAYHDAAGDKIGIIVNDGPAEEVAFNSAGIYASTSRMQVGSNSASSAALFGLVRNVTFWKGRKLSATEINDIYKMGFHDYSEFSSGQKTNMTAHYPLNESSGQRNDSHTNGLHLSDTGSIASRQLSMFGLADFVDAANPTNFKSLVFTDNLVRVTSNASWYADGYVS